MPMRTIENEPKKRRRRILRSFKIDEISIVDRPAQEHARALVTKSRDAGRSEMRFDKLERENEPMSFDTFADAMIAIMRWEGLSGIAAMKKMRERHPELFNKLQSNAPSSRPQPGGREIAKAVRDFDDLVDQVAHDRGVSKTAAMSIARRQFPKAFETLQAG